MSDKLTQTAKILNLLKRKVARWWKNVYLEFYLDTYLISFQTRLHREAFERMTYDICRLRVQIMRKKVFEFDLYKRERW